MVKKKDARCVPGAPTLPQHNTHTFASSSPSSCEAAEFHGSMVHKEGGGLASECKTEKNAIKYRLAGATHQGCYAKCS